MKFVYWYDAVTVVFACLVGSVNDPAKVSGLAGEVEPDASGNSVRSVSCCS